MFNDIAYSVTNSFSHYAKYKSSGIDWLGEVPEHWGIQRLKFALTESDVKSESGTEQLLSVSHKHGIVQRGDVVGENRVYSRSEEFIGYKVVKVGQLAVNIMLAWNGSSGVSRFDGIVSPAYAVYSVAPFYLPSYLHYLLRCEAMKAEIKRRSRGIMESRLRLYSPDLYDISAPKFEIHEQLILVNFLDAKTKEIEEAINLKQRTIELLDEYKHSLIQQAVTKGLDPTVPMKDSGVNWLGEVPEHWGIQRLKFALTESDVKSESGTEQLLSVSHKHGIVQRGDVVGENRVYSRSEEFIGYKVVKVGQLAVNIMLAWNGSSGVSRFDGIVSPAYAVYSVAPFYLPSYLHYLLRCEAMKAEIKRRSRGIMESRLRLYSPDLYDISAPKFEIHEQLAVVNFLDAKTKEIEEAKSGIQLQIRHLKEYKDSLIESAVTGKIKVAEP